MNPQAVNTSFYSNNIISGADRKDPEKVAGMFEGMLYRMMLEEMRNEEFEDPLFGSSQMQQIQGMYNDELAMHLGNQGHLGFKSTVTEAVQRAEQNTNGLLKPQK